MTPGLKLNAVERRVLGVLIEKSMTTPGGYPLTLNALVAGCNQLTCREPVLKLGDEEVSKAAQDLKKQRLVKEADYDKGARVDRFLHAAQGLFGADPAGLAIMAELLLRGPQTPGELKTNASRMTPIADLQVVSRILSDYGGRDPALVVELPRQPGKSAQRHDHRLYAEDPGSGAVPAAPSVSPSDLESRIARLEASIEALQRDVRELRKGSEGAG